jgi:perosamine synthetase
MKYSIAWPYFPEHEIEWILSEFKTILSGNGMLSMGDHVRKFEKEFADYIGASFAVGTNSCSAALEIALRSIGLQPGEEVIVPVETFIATGAAVVREGGRPVFAEINPETFCITLDSIKEKVTDKTRAIIIVHLAGLISSEIFSIKEYCDKKGFILIEDAAHAHGAEIDGRKAGSLGHIGCFSFFPTKMMTTAEGGMAVTSDESIYHRVSSYRNRGLDLSANSEQYSDIGTNNRMTEIAAIMGRSQLRYLDKFVAMRNRVASIYNDIISSSELNKFFKLVAVPPNVVNSYWRYIVSLDANIERKKLKDLMTKDGIPIDWAYYPPLHLQPVFIKLYGNRKGMSPLSEEILEHNICLPMHVCIKDNDAMFIAERLLLNVRTLLESKGLL